MINYNYLRGIIGLKIESWTGSTADRWSLQNGTAFFQSSLRLLNWLVVLEFHLLTLMVHMKVFLRRILVSYKQINHCQVRSYSEEILSSVHVGGKSAIWNNLAYLGLSFS